MSRLLIQAELVKLSRLLGTPERELEFLASEPVESLRALRAAVARSIVDEDRVMFSKLVAATKLLPAVVVATIAERAMGPMICARVAGLLDPDQVVEVARRLSTPFLADVCLQLDPRSAAATLGRMPLPVVLAVGTELLRRGEYLTMARFVEVISDEAVAAIARKMPDAAVLRVGFFVESRERLGELVGLFDDRRIAAIIAATASDPDELWPQALSLMEQTDAEASARLVRLGLAGGDDGIAVSLLRVVNAQGLHASLLAILARLDGDVLARIGRLPAVSDVELLRPTLEAAEGAGLREALRPLTRGLSAPARKVLAALL